MEKTKEEIKKIIKPKLTVGIIVTIVCLGPFGNLILSIAIKNYNRILIYALFSFPTLIFIGFYWCWHVFKNRNLNLDIDKVYELINSDKIIE